MSWGERSCVVKNCKIATMNSCNVNCKEYLWDNKTKPDSVALVKKVETPKAPDFTKIEAEFQKVVIAETAEERKCVNVRAQLDHMEDMWKRVQKTYEGKKPITTDEWQRFCHLHNNQLRQQLEAYKEFSDARYLKQVLAEIFGLWQSQYRLATMKVGKIVGVSKFKKEKRFYTKFRKILLGTLHKYKEAQ